MPHIFVEERLAELRRLDLMSTQVEPGLLQSEKLEMVDQESAQKHREPADPERGPDEVAYRRVRDWIDAPDDCADRTPQNEQDHQRDACSEHVHAAFDRRRDDLHPPALEALTRHHAVLKPEQGDQADVDQSGGDWSASRTVVDGQFGEGEIADEHYEVKEGREEDRVGGNREQHCSKP